MSGELKCPISVKLFYSYWRYYKNAVLDFPLGVGYAKGKYFFAFFVSSLEECFEYLTIKIQEKCIHLAKAKKEDERNCVKASSICLST